MNNFIIRHILIFSIAVMPVIGEVVDFHFAPAEWQTLICLPDDPQKTLVDKSGSLLYHYQQGGAEFGVRLKVELDESVQWRDQRLTNPRVPIVRTLKKSACFQVVEETFAVTRLPRSLTQAETLVRRDDGCIKEYWARPPRSLDASLRHAAWQENGVVECAALVNDQKPRLVALVLCEGECGKPGDRILTLEVEGAEKISADAVAVVGRNVPCVHWFNGSDVDGDGEIRIRVESDQRSRHKAAALNGIWLFDDGLTQRDDQALLSGALNGEALWHGIDTSSAVSPRNDLMLISVSNITDSAQILRPKLIVDTPLGCVFSADGSGIIVRGDELITCSEPIVELKKTDKFRFAAIVNELVLQPGQTKSFSVLYSVGRPLLKYPDTVAKANVCRTEAEHFWQQVRLPWGRLNVPDSKIQALLDSAIRNIWQSREIVDDLPVFQVGPTCYRGLWMVDGAFILEAVTMLGAEDEARRGVTHAFKHQRDDGRIDLLNYSHKENGIMLWSCFQHARMTQDKQWLSEQWPALLRIGEAIKTLRRESFTNAIALDDGLMPPGFPDGGIGGVHAEYANVYWNLMGIKVLADAAAWLNKQSESNYWLREYQDFMHCFRQAAERDLWQDNYGNAYLPIIMGEAGRQELPQRAQWTFCHAVYPGRLFKRGDALVAGNLAMLKAVERQGLVYGTGWDDEGLWSYFASFYAHAWLWLGNPKKAAELLYAFADHAAPTLVWCEEQSLHQKPFKKVGDMPHSWAGAELIRLVMHLLVLERGGELHLLEGMPSDWLRPGALTELRDVRTVCGRLTMQVRVSSGGQIAHVKIDPITGSECSKIVLHLGRKIVLSPNRQHILEVPLL